MSGVITLEPWDDRAPAPERAADTGAAVRAALGRAALRRLDEPA